MAKSPLAKHHNKQVKKERRAVKLARKQAHKVIREINNVELLEKLVAILRALL